MNRRQFLTTTTATAAAAGASLLELPQVLGASKRDWLEVYGGFPMGIQSYSLRGFGVDEALDKTRALGLHWIEFFSAHYASTSDPAKVEEMNKKLSDRHIMISAYGVQSFTKDHAKNRRMFQFAKRAGIKVISADPAPDSFDSLDRLVEEFPIRIAIHNHGPGARYDQPKDAWKAVAGHDRRIGFCADLGHYIRSGVDPVEVIYLLGDRLYGIHLKDFDAAKRNAKGVVLGRGLLDVEGVFTALKKVRFPAYGALSLEYEEHPKNPMAEIRECLQVARAAARKVAAS